jgi:hypothetical protein
MGSNMRLLHEHIGLTVPLAASSAADGFPASNLETGHRALFWKATSSAEQTLTWDAGTGNTKTCDAVVLPRADRLVTVAANVAVQWSNDGVSSWTDAFTPETPIQSGDLAGPGGTDYVMEFSSLTKRAWRIRLYGSMTGAAMLAGGLFLGARYEVAKNPLYERALGVSRTYRGLEVELSWGHWAAEADARALLTALAAVTPDAAEGPQETVSGLLFGGRPHYLYDPLGAVFRTSGTPYLLPVLCLTPEAALTQTPAKGIERGPTGVRWRERR